MNVRPWRTVGAAVLAISSLCAAGQTVPPERGPSSVVAAAPHSGFVSDDVQLARRTPSAAPRDPYVWHVLVTGPERVILDRKSPRRVVLRGRNPSHRKVRDWDRRQIFTERGGGRSTNQEVCATWRSQSARAIQQGLAVRVRGGASGGRQRAITVTKNVYAGYYWVFNVLTWDTRRRGDAWRAVDQFDMSDVLVRNGHWVPFPWRVCLRVRGRTVSFKVWLPDDDHEPRWNDASHARSASVPSRFVMRGRPGWYVGHLPAGQVTDYVGLRH